ncbi:MAG: adenylate/guanylate cyclase domain-containing protein [Pseudomonadota bacterium]
MQGESIADIVEVLDTGSEALTVEEVLARRADFVPMRTLSDDKLLGVSGAGAKTWLRFQVANPASVPRIWYLSMERRPNPQVNYAGFLQITQQGEVHKLGEINLAKPSSHALLDIMYLSARVLTPIQGKHWLYVELHSVNHLMAGQITPSNVSTIPRIWSAQGFLSYTVWQTGVFIALISGIAFIGFYNLLLFFSIRDSMYLYYVAYLVSVCAFFLFTTRLISSDIFSNELQAAHLTVLCVVLTACRFTQVFLQTNIHAPRLHRILYVLIVLTIFGIIAVLIDSTWATTPLIAGITYPSLLFSSLILMPFIGAWIWWKGFRLARFYVLAWTLLAIATMFINVQIQFSASLYSAMAFLLPAYALEAILLSFALGDRFKILGEEKAAREQLLGKVVSPAIADELMSKDLELGGEERQATILFSDIRGFTTLSENRSPKEILQLLNEYLSEISTVIDRNHGVVDKYVGDEVMALFGAPLQRPDDAANAVRTALKMREALTGMNQSFQQRGMPEISLGIGINTGLVVAGNMGSETRLNYTVIGDSVNLASRLEGLTKQYGVELVVSESTKAAALEFVYRELDKVRVKGKLEPVKIYEVMGTQNTVSEVVLQEIEAHHQALTLFQAQSWQDAQTAFAELREQYPQIRLYQLYQERIAAYLESPPDDNWDGVYTLLEK